MDTTNPDLQATVERMRALRMRANRVTESIHNRAYDLAARHGITGGPLCVHNASIDDAMKGWCAGNPEGLRAAKTAALILADWTAARLADRINNRLWNAYSEKLGWLTSQDNTPAPTINRALLFGQH